MWVTPTDRRIAVGAVSVLLVVEVRRWFAWSHPRRSPWVVCNPEATRALGKVDFR